MLKEILTLTLLVSLGILINQVNTAGKNGNFFEAIIDHVDILHLNEDFGDVKFKVRKVNGDRAVFGYMNLKVQLGNEVTLEVKALKKQGGEYRYLPYGIKPAPFCDLTADEKMFYPDLAKNSDLPEDMKTNCPLKPGNYSLNGVIFGMENVPKMIVPSGDYAIEIIFNKNDENLAIARAFGTVNQV